MPPERLPAPASLAGPRVALVTGANGFVGSWLCHALGGAGIQVRGIGRHGPGPLAQGVAYHRADLLDAAALRPALAGADTVVHLAARVHVMRESAREPLSEFRRINVDGTRVLLEEAVRAGVARLVFASTVKAVGESSPVPWTEEAVPRPADPYGVSKLEAEELVRDMAERHSLQATTLRLPLVYGPGMKGNMLSLFHLVDRGIPLPLGLVHNRRSMAFVGNVAAAMLAVVQSPPARPRTFFVSDGRDLSTPELLRLIGRALDRKVRLLPVPSPLFRAAGRIGDLVSRLRQVPLTSAAVDRLLGSLTVDASALTRAVGFRPPYSVEEGLRITAEWYLRREGAWA
jgi:nucleoside-diphosphate-sugar epimerase